MFAPFQVRKGLNPYIQFLQLRVLCSDKETKDTTFRVKADKRMQPGQYSSLIATNLQRTTNQDRNDQCGNQHYSRELLMMGIVVPKTC